MPVYSDECSVGYTSTNFNDCDSGVATSPESASTFVFPNSFVSSPTPFSSGIHQFISSANFLGTALTAGARITPPHPILMNAIFQSQLAYKLPIAPTFPLTPCAMSFEGAPILLMPFHPLQPSLDAFQQAWAHRRKLDKIDTTGHYSVFVGDLSADVNDQMLREAFEKCGTVSQARVMRDPQSMKSRKFGFVYFPAEKDAKRAVEMMHGVMIGHKPIRVNWGFHKNSAEELLQGRVCDPTTPS